jgi:hypothetical protein
MAKRTQPLQTTLTVKDIAERTKRPGEELQTAIDRLRNWSDQGLISQIGEESPGKGRARRYGHDALLEAALLEVLTGAIGIPAAQAAPHLRAIKKEVAKDWEKAGPFQPGPPVPVIMVATLEGSPGQNSLDQPWLVISRYTGNPGTLTRRVLLKELPQHLQHPQTKRYDAHTMIDLQLMFKRLLRPMKEV